MFIKKTLKSIALKILVDAGGVLQYSTTQIVNDDNCTDSSFNPDTELCVYDGYSGTCFVSIFSKINADASQRLHNL